MSLNALDRARMGLLAGGEVIEVAHDRDCASRRQNVTIALAGARAPWREGGRVAKRITG
jgi:hypothetical protein